MENLVRAITDYLRSLTNDHENINAPSDFLQFLLETLMEDLFQLSADMDVEVARQSSRCRPPTSHPLGDRGMEDWTSIVPLWHTAGDRAAVQSV